ncbi:hypothetical protein AYO44_04990 [Planctomycetaceae bacterium SCGC AG-212-F19]|nr:hypothetical protein AYO44_04990 [Planctomycetaceae bacterium SCGC AG-212-F19]
MMPLTPTLALGQQYHRAGDYPRAEAVYRDLMQRGPPSAELLYLLGSACLAQQNLPETIAYLRQAVALQPDYPEALHNLGVALAQQRHFPEAAAYLRRAAQVRPGWLEPITNLGRLLQDQGDLDEAITCFCQALELHDTAEQHNQLGCALALRGDYHLAVAHFSEAVRQEPRYAVAHTNLLLALSHDPTQEPAALLAEHRWWGRLHGPEMAFQPTFTNQPDPDRRLRIGYVSPDFRRGPLAAFIEPVLAAHDLAEVETFAYAELSQPDAVTQRLQGQVSGWRFTRGLNDVQVAELIRTDGIDVLVDLAGHTANHRLGVFAMQPAPVQVTYLGYPGTTGLATIAYRLTDAVADPPGEPVVHTEALVQLLGCFCCYAPPAEAPAVVPHPSGDYPITFGAPHKLLKLNERVLDLWARVLHAVPHSRLLISRNTLTAQARDRLVARFGSQGIGAERLELRKAAPDAAGYFGTYQAMDILLDSFPWTGHATTCEALWMGVPVVTLAGNRFASRMAASVLNAIGLPELIATNEKQYVATAARLATDRVELTRMRDELRPRMQHSPLCDASVFTRGLETAYRKMWRDWCKRSSGHRSPATS